MNGTEGAGKGEAFPVSFAQQRLWMLDRLEPDGCVYNIPSPAWILGRLNVPTLRRALQEIFRRHEALRTTFAVVDDDLMQIIAPETPLEVPLIDLAHLPESERETEAMRLMREDACKPFNLAKDLMLRTGLIRLGPEKHLLKLTMHHIASDGWSLGVFYRELQVLYEAFLREQPSPLPDPPIQYADFSVWQRHWLRGATLQRQLDYWKKQLTGAPGLLELPQDHPRPPLQSYRGGPPREFVLEKEILEPFKALCHAEGCSLFMGLLAAFKTVVWRHTGQSDVVVGSPIANRNRTEIEGLIGSFINTLVLRTDVSGEPTFRELMRRVRQVTLDAYANQDLPCEKLVEELQPARDQSYSPLFQLMFVLQNTPQPSHAMADLELAPFAMDNGTAKFDLTLFCTEDAERLTCSAEYASDLFEPDTIQRLLGHLETLIAGAVANPDERISRLPLLTTAEREQVLVDWNNTRAEYPHHRCLHEFFAEQTARTPEATALVFRNQRLTYSELNRKADRIAAHLRSLGMGPENLIGLCIERSLEMVVGLLGILKAGAAYVPLDPNYPPERLAFILEDAKVPILLTQEALLGNLPKPNGPIATRVLCLDPELSAFDSASESQSETQPTSDNLAYVLYTSGSTGKPKGVQITHRAMVNFLLSMAKEPGLSASDVLLAVTTLSFDIAGLELWLPLLVGAQVVIADSETARESKRLAQALEESRATVMQATPVTWRMLLESGWMGNPHLKILCGGEAWGSDLAEALLSKCGSLWNMYGPTETTIWSAAVQVKPGEAPSIGGPIANTQLYVLDSHLQPVPIGVSGELHIGGDGLARGYLNRPELTAKKFVSDPFRQAAGTRLYKTGDLVRYRSNGRLEFLGRQDHQVKIRGFRIELGEIESVLRNHPNVREAAVVASPDAGGEKCLAAYTVARQTPGPTTADLRAHLKEKLPEYMVPSVFMALDAFPLTPNGKLDRKALPSPNVQRTAKAFVAPRDPLELQLAQIWEKIFAREPIGIRDNFFDLGGHSLLAVKLFTQVEKLTGKNLPLVTLFQAPTIEQLAAILRQQGWESPWSSLVPIKADGSKPPFYCVHGVGGNILEYLDLAKYMEADQPFYGLQAAGLSGRHAWHKTVEEMAAHYVKEIRAFQPRGPYYIGGSSFGGMVAFEMARLLQVAGEHVALLAFFDTYAPGYPKYLPNTSAWRMKLDQMRLRFDLHWGNFMAARGLAKLDYVGSKTKRYAFSVSWRLKRMKRRTKERLEALFHPKTIKAAQKTGQHAACAYMPPGTYAGRAVLFRATGKMKGIYPDPLQGWGPFVAGGLEIYDTPGHHGAIVREPRAGVLAEQLKDALHKAQTAAEAERKKAHDAKAQVPHAMATVAV